MTRSIQKQTKKRMKEEASGKLEQREGKLPALRKEKRSAGINWLCEAIRALIRVCWDYAA
jgi:hypothetical protein